MAERKETAQRDAQGVRKQSYKRFKEGRDYEATDGGDMIALCDMMERGIFNIEEETTENGEKIERRGGRPRNREIYKFQPGRIRRRCAFNTRHRGFSPFPGCFSVYSIRVAESPPGGVFGHIKKRI